MFCTKLLADLGADVVRVEPPGGGPDRRRPPLVAGREVTESSLDFLFYNTNKRSITLDVTRREGRELLLELVRRADAVVETFAPAELEALDLDYPALAAINPRLVVASITPFGRTGPRRAWRGADIVVMAASGFMQVTGEPDGPPMRLGNEQSHFAPGQYAALAVVAALYERETSGLGQHIDISAEEALITYYLEQHPALCWQMRHQNVSRAGKGSTLVIPFGVYPCRDGWIGIGVVTLAEWDAFAAWVSEVTGNPELLDERYRGGMHARAPYRDLVEALIMDFTSRFTREELFHEGQRRNLVFVPVNTVADLLADPQLAAMPFWAELHHAVVGRLRYPLDVLGGDVRARRRAAPKLGEHNEDIYAGELGLSDEEVAALRARRII